MTEQYKPKPDVIQPLEEHKKPPVVLPSDLPFAEREEELKKQYGTIIAPRNGWTYRELLRFRLTGETPKNSMSKREY